MREGEFTAYNGPQRHPWVGAIYMHFFHPALVENPDFAQAIGDLFALERSFHCIRQAFVLDKDKEMSRRWLSQKHLSMAIFDHYQTPLNDQAGKITNVRGFFPGALIVFVSPFPEHMDVGADVHIGITQAKISFGNKNKNFTKHVQLADMSDICLTSYLQLAPLAKGQLLVGSIRERNVIISDIQRKRQIRALQKMNKEA